MMALLIILQIYIREDGMASMMFKEGQREDVKSNLNIQRLLKNI